MSLRPVALALASVLATGCAGSTEFTSCAPLVCGCEPGECAQIVVAPGGIGQSITATLLAEGSHAGPFMFTATTDEGATAEVTPASAEVDGEIDVLLSIQAPSDAVAGDTFFVSLDARHERKEVGAGFGFLAEVQ